MQLSYYPGCSLHASGKEFDLSTKGVCEQLGVELVEIDDWNCCGASSAHSLSDKLALALAARNIMLAEKQGFDIVIPCAACYNRTRVAHKTLSDEPELRKELEETFNMGGSSASTQIESKHILEVFQGQEMMEQVREKVKRPLEDLKAVCYYGCLLTRPEKITGFDNTENPESMDELMKAIGVDVLDWSYKIDCCGASLSLTRMDIVNKLTGKLFLMAKEAGADCIIVACPLCHSNLDLRQKEISEDMGQDFNLPIYYFTELMGIAFGLPDAPKWLKKHAINAADLVSAG